jgi:hypothetical protein
MAERDRRTHRREHLGQVHDYIYYRRYAAFRFREMTLLDRPWNPDSMTKTQRGGVGMILRE